MASQEKILYIIFEFNLLSYPKYGKTAKNIFKFMSLVASFKDILTLIDLSIEILIFGVLTIIDFFVHIFVLFGF